MSREYGWDTVGREEGGGGGRFLMLNDGDAVRVRVLDEAPMSFKVHQVSAPNTDGVQTFRSIPATTNPDDNEIMRLSHRFPPKRRFAIRVAVLDQDGEVESFRILEGGPQIFGQLKKLVQVNGDVNSYDIMISRDGEGRDTTYTVQASPKSFNVDVEDAVRTMEENDEMSMDVAYPEVTGEQQLQLLAEAKIDLSVDHIALMAEEMDPSVAKNMKMPFGKYEGKTIGDVAKIDTGYLIWAAENVTSNDEVAAAVTCVLANLGALDKGSAPSRKKIEKPKAAPDSEPEDDSVDLGDVQDEIPEWPLKQSPEDYLARWDGKGGKHVDLARLHVEAQHVDEPEEEAPAPKTGAKQAGGDDELVAAVTELLKTKYTSAMEVLKAIRAHSATGESRVSDLTREELEGFLEELMG